MCINCRLFELLSYECLNLQYVIFHILSNSFALTELLKKSMFSVVLDRYINKKFQAVSLSCRLPKETDINYCRKADIYQPSTFIHVHDYAL